MNQHHTDPMRPTHSQYRLHNRLVRSASRAGVAMLMIAAVNVVAGATSGAAVKGTITVTPSTGVVGSVGTWKQGTTVTIHGSGWAPNAQVGWCQGIPSVGTPSDQYCGTGTITLGTADATGHFSGSLVLARYLSIPALGHSVDCGNPAVTCGIGAADRSDVANTGRRCQPEVRSDTSHCDPRHCHRLRGRQRYDHRDRAGHPHRTTRHADPGGVDDGVRSRRARAPSHPRNRLHRQERQCHLRQRSNSQRP